MTDQSAVRAVQHIMATLFSAQNALRELAPNFRWAGLGNLLGDYGEFVAIEAYGLTKASAGSGGYDATTHDGQTVQIKANHAASQIGFRGEADLMLVLKVETNGQWNEVYYGSFAKAKELARYSARDNKHMVAIRQLIALNQADGVTVPVEPIHVDPAVPPEPSADD
jgi:hypothetical protein